MMKRKAKINRSLAVLFGRLRCSDDRSVKWLTQHCKKKSPLGDDWTTNETMDKGNFQSFSLPGYAQWKCPVPFSLSDWRTSAQTLSLLIPGVKLQRNVTTLGKIRGKFKDSLPGTNVQDGFEICGPKQTFQKSISDLL